MPPAPSTRIDKSEVDYVFDNFLTDDDTLGTNNSNFLSEKYQSLANNNAGDVAFANFQAFASKFVR